MRSRIERGSAGTVQKSAGLSIPVRRSSSGRACGLGLGMDMDTDGTVGMGWFMAQWRTAQVGGTVLEQNVPFSSVVKSPVGGSFFFSTQG
jgi:hypothetical protein